MKMNRAIRLLTRRRAGLRQIQSRSLSGRASSIIISEEVREALKSKKPVVALETTIYTHGFPHPQNIALSELLESTVRKNGGIPATIGILDGIPRVGMNQEEINELLESAGSDYTIKVSRQNLSYACGAHNPEGRYSGGTTIAGTLLLAHLAGIDIVATGGLGGVHRGAEVSMDISADLTELGRTPVFLVTSGCKSFLDIPRTLEYLETEGVGVCTFADGRSSPVSFPGFWTRESGVPSPMTVSDEKEAARIAFAQKNMSVQTGLLFANPIPESVSLAKDLVDKAMDQAVREAEEKGITGSRNTPYVLTRIREITKGATVEANRVLVEANVVRGTRLAVELAKLDQMDSFDADPSQRYPKLKSAHDAISLPGKASVIVAGALAQDISCDYHPDSKDSNAPNLQTSNPARIYETLGGVGLNVATACHYAGAKTLLCSIVGDDSAGTAVFKNLRQRGMPTEGVSVRPETHTARYVAMNGRHKDLMLAMADMQVFEGNISDFRDHLSELLQMHSPSWAVLDANWSGENFEALLTDFKAAGCNIAFEPVSLEKSTRALRRFTPVNSQDRLNSGRAFNYMANLASPNKLELLTMASVAHKDNSWVAFVHSFPDWKARISKLLPPHLQHLLLDVVIGALELLPVVPTLLVKLGSEGVLLLETVFEGDPRLRSPSFHRSMILGGKDIPGTYTFGSSGVFEQNFEEVSQSKAVAGVHLQHFGPATVIPQENIVSVNGIGDTFLGALIAGLAERGFSALSSLIMPAQEAAALTLLSQESVSPQVRSIATKFTTVN